MTAQLIRLREAARRLGVSEKALRRKVARREITHCRPTGPRGLIMFLESDIEALLARPETKRFFHR